MFIKSKTGLMFFLWFLLALPACAIPPGTLSTLAGGGVGDGAPAKDTCFTYVNGLTLDAQGNPVLFDLQGARVRKVDLSTGLIHTIAGDGDLRYSYRRPSADGHVHYEPWKPDTVSDGGSALDARITPAGGVFDSHGNLYIADKLNNRIRKVNAETGIISTVAGTGIDGQTGDGGPAIEAQIHLPDGLAIDSEDNLFINERNRIRKVSASTGIITSVMGADIYAEEILIDSIGDLIFTSPSLNQIRRVNLSTNTISTLTNIPSPRGLCQDPSGYLFVTSQGRICRVDPVNGGITTVLKPEDYNPTKGPNFSILAMDVQADSNGNLFFCSGGAFGNQLFKVDWQAKTVTLIAGNGSISYSGNELSGTEASLNMPWGIAADTQGNIYFSDCMNHRVRRVDAKTHVITTIAGSTRALNDSFDEDVKDGGPALEVKLAYPKGIALDSQGNVYFADSYHGRVRCIDAATGIIRTVAGGGKLIVGNIEGMSATTVHLPVPPALIALDNSGYLYYTGCNFNKLLKINLGTGIIESVIQILDKPSPYICPSLALDHSGNIYYNDLYHVYELDAITNQIKIVAGGGSTSDGVKDGIPAISAYLNGINSLAFDSQGNLFIAEIGTKRIRRVDSETGIISTVVGGASISPEYYDRSLGDGSSALGTPIEANGIAFDQYGNLLIADNYNNRIRCVSGIGILSVDVQLNSGWNMVSVPLISVTGQWADASAVFGKDLPDKIYSWDSSTATYLSESLMPGKGYWMKMSAPTTATLKGVSQGTSCTIDILGDSSGKWNLIGNPLTTPITWDSAKIKVQNGNMTLSLKDAHMAGWIRDYGWIWDGKQYQLLADPKEYTVPGIQSTLGVMGACWIRAFKDCQIVVTAN